jgi:SAM-dependent methyltransferase
VSEFLRREQVPVHQNLIFSDQACAAKIGRGDLDLRLCEACGFIFNRAFDPEKIMYGEEYDNTQSHSPSFNEYLDELVSHMVVEENVRGEKIVEVGCGKGLFLRKLVEFEGAGNTGRGFDPSYAGEDLDLDGRLTFERRYYDAECADVPADVVVSRHVIEHVPDPLRLLRNIRQALVNSRDARIFIETPCVRWILRNHVIWDFFYEHCSYFTAESLATALRMAGFAVQSVRHVFKGQYLWLEARVAVDASPVTREPGDVPALAAQFALAERRLTGEWEAKVKGLTSRGGVALWGAGAKGVTFANLIDPAREWIECVVDLNPSKQGGYVPGTGHSIISPRELTSYGVKSAILMNPNYREENLALLRESGIDVALI